MNQMKQKSATIIELRKLMERDDGWGNEEGRQVFQRLIKAIEDDPGKLVYGISLRGVKRTDASFPRESVVELARRYRGRKGFYLLHIADRDLLDNWEAAAIKREQPLTVWSNAKPEIIGRNPTAGNKGVLDFVLSCGEVTAANTAKQLKLQLTNASTKLRQLEQDGFIMRRDETSATGGIEYKYFRIG
jgi:hypothetical protein